MEDRMIYRASYGAELSTSYLTIGETDLALCLPAGVYCMRVEDELTDYLLDQRARLQAYIAEDPDFAATHEPHRVLPSAPNLAREMAEAAAKCGVGPMAAVAGAFAATAGRLLARYTKEVIVENGGDIYLNTTKDRVVGVYAGEDSPFTGSLGLKVLSGQQPLGVCSSSGRVGPSHSYGQADVAVVLALNTLLADAAATATANHIQSPEQLQAAVDFALTIPGVLGALAISGKQMAVRGQIELCNIGK